MFTNSHASMRAAATFLETLTTPDSEDWVIIPRGKKVFVTAMREDRLPSGKKQTQARLGFSPTDGIKELVHSLPKDHRLGLVTITLLRDSEKFGGFELVQWFTKLAREKNFSVTSMAGPATTAEAIRAAKSRANQPCRGSA
jgi:hypothetical protein